MITSSKAPTDLQAELGAAMRSLRLNRHMKQSDVAAKGGISLKALAKLERGEGSSVETLVRALNALDATDVIGRIAPEPTISPLAMLRQGTTRPRRVRDQARRP